MVGESVSESGLEGFPGGLVAQALVGAFVGVVVEIRLQSCMTIGSAGLALEIALLVLHRSPKSLDHHVINRPSLPIHADLDRLIEQPTGELPARELGTLVGVEDLRTALTQGLFQSLQAELHVNAVRETPRARTSRLNQSITAANRTLQNCVAS